MYVRCFVTKYWAPLLLFIVGVVACWANYTPGTFLSGWDTLHPEFNFSLAFTRAFSGVFRPEQGLGAVAAHSHMADLPHIILLWLMHFVLQPVGQVLSQPNESLLRYAYIFLCFLVGPVGMYFFLERLLHNKMISFVGSLFYMLNIGTVQLFYIPFEMFTTQFAILPFLFLFATDFFFKPARKPLVGFIITTIFASPTAFAAPLWYVMFVVLSSYCITLAFLAKNMQHQFRRVSVLLGLFLAGNLYWILPNIYFVLLHGQAVTQAAGNQLFSEEAFLYNKAFGNVFSLALLRTFYFNWQIYSNAAFVQLFSFWKNYFTTPIVTLGFSFFVCMIVGLIQTFREKSRLLLSFFPSLIISLVFLLNDNLPFHIYSFFEHIPLFQEAFRFPDDKILGVYVFLYTIFFSVGLTVLSSLFKQRLQIFFSFTFAFFIFLVSFPIFQGHLIHPAMRVVIPNEYFSLFDYMNGHSPGRIATLPINSPWGWEYYNWQHQQPPANTVSGFQGSGFLYFGLKDPTMDRDFDRWSPFNESYYHELSYAVYAQNQQLFASVLRKYDISYLLLDTSILSPGDSPDVLDYGALRKLIQKSHYRILAEFSNHLFVYQTQPPSSPLAYQEHLPEETGKLSSFIDTSYLHNDNYITTTFNDPIDNLARAYPLPLIQTVQSSFAKNFFPVLADSQPVNTCPSPSFPVNDTSKTFIQTLQPFVEYVATNGQYCDHINVTTRNANTPFLVTIVSRNLSGLSLRVCIADTTNNHCIIQTKLPYSQNFTKTTIVVPPLPTRRLSINFANIGIAPTTAINDIAGIQEEDLPPQKLSIQAMKNTLQPLAATTTNNKTIYTVPAAPSGATLVLSQSYEPGWQLYAIDPAVPSWLSQTLPYLVGKPTGHHVLIDSWENGWVLPKEEQLNHNQYVIIFLPQYLEYIGFGIEIVIITIVLITIAMTLKTNSLLLLQTRSHHTEKTLFVLRKAHI